MPDLYLWGHSGTAERSTFVPDGIRVHAYAEEGYAFPRYAAMLVLTGHGGPPRETIEPGSPVTNYEIRPHGSCARAVQLSCSAPSLLPDVLAVEEPTALCTGDCTPATGHTCAGVLGTVGPHTAVHLLICRGENQDYTPYPGEEDVQREIIAFLELPGPERERHWRRMCQASPGQRDAFLADSRQVNAWLTAYGVLAHSDRGFSEFTVVRYVEALDEESRALLDQWASREAACAEVADRYEAQKARIDLFLFHIALGSALEPWRAMDPASCEDLLAMRCTADTVYDWLGSVGGEGAWRHAVGEGEWVQLEGEPVLRFRDAYYAVLRRPRAPVWPTCREELWCKVAYAHGAAGLVRLGTHTTPRRYPVHRSDGGTRYVP